LPADYADYLLLAGQSRDFHCLCDMEERGTFVTKKPGRDHAVSL